MARLKLGGPVVVVSDAGLARIGLADQVAGRLGAEDLFAWLEGEPTAEQADRVASQLRGRTVTVVGLGGGSALDLTKLAAASAGAEASCEAYAACQNPLPEGLATVLIPTTAGTGSEMSRTAVFSDREGRKTWAWGEQLQAQQAVLDPELTLGLPLLATKLTAVDALSHALEAATAVNKTSLTTPLCHQAVAMIPKALERVLQTPDDLEGRETLLNASALAGMALNSCGTGLAHALAHALGSLVKVSHGLAIARSLRVTLQWNPPQVYQRFDWLAQDPHGCLSRWLDGLELPPLPNFEAEALAAALALPENQPMLDNNARPVATGEYLTLAKQLQEHSQARQK